MAPPLKTHINELIEVAAKYPDSPAMKVPQFSADGVFTGYETLSYTEFLRDVENSSRYWANELSKYGLKQGDVVGLW